MQVTRLVEGAHAAGRIIAAVCHGPAALLEAKGADGRLLVAGKQARFGLRTSSILHEGMCQIFRAGAQCLLYIRVLLPPSPGEAYRIKEQAR